MGRVLDKPKAKQTACKVYEGGMVFSEGILGPLKENQAKKYCPEKVQMKSEGLEEQWDRIRRISVIQDVCLESGVSEEDFNGCVKDGGDLIGEGLPRDKIEKELAHKYGVEVD